MGRVKSNRIGLMTILSSPTTTAANSAVVKLSILKPGTIYEATNSDNALKSQVKSNPIILFMTQGF